MKSRPKFARSGAPIWAAGLAALAVIATGLHLAHAEAPPVCGAPSKPACPLQHWMRTHLATALAHKDQKALAQSLDALVAINPEPSKWHNWNKFARDGARDARRGREHGVIAACEHCHSIYRPEYNVKYRTRRVRAPADLPRTSDPDAPARD